MWRRTAMVLCFAAGLSAAHAVPADEDAKARALDSYTTIESTGETLLHRRVVLPNVDTGEPEIFEQVLRQNPDGSLSTVPTLISDELRERNEKICAKRGGTDATAEGVMTITPNVLEFYQCNLPVQKEEKTSESGSSGDKLEIASGTGTITRLEGTGITRTPPGRNVLQTAAYEVSFFGGRVVVNYSIQVDLCTYSGQQVYGTNGDPGSARRAWGGRCLVHRGTEPGTVYESIAQACTSSGSCKSASGAIIVE